MKTKIYIAFTLFILLSLGLLAFRPAMMIEQQAYKCLIQLSNYEGEGAYVVVSLVKPDDNYEKTLYVFGDDPEWQEEFEGWWKFWSKDKTNIDAITGESIVGGDRKIVKFKVDKSKLDQGYKLRFETAVEDQEYYFPDLEVPYTKEGMKGKLEGTGYIRYVRLIPN